VNESDSRFDVNKDVVDGQVINKVETSPEDEAERVASDEDLNAKEVMKDYLIPF